MTLLANLNLSSRIQLSIFISILTTVIITEFVISEVFALQGMHAIIVSFMVSAAVALVYSLLASLYILQPIDNLIKTLKQKNAIKSTDAIAVAGSDEIAQIAALYNKAVVSSGWKKLATAYSFTTAKLAISNDKKTIVAATDNLFLYYETAVTFEWNNSDRLSDFSNFSQIIIDLEKPASYMKIIDDNKIQQVKNLLSGLEKSAIIVKGVQDNLGQGKIAAVNVSKFVTELHDSLDSVDAVVDKAITNLGTVNILSQQIKTVLQIIDGACAKINKLALSISIEAARFDTSNNVISALGDEIRYLSQRSLDASHEIKEIYSSLLYKIDNANAAATDESRKIELIAKSQAHAQKEIARVLHAFVKLLELSQVIEQEIKQQSQKAATITEQPQQVFDFTVSQHSSPSIITDELKLASQETLDFVG